MGRLSGRTAIVTGGAKGIGRHYSQALAAEGAEVVIADIADGESLAQEIAAKFGRNAGMSITCDVSDEAAVRHHQRHCGSYPTDSVVGGRIRSYGAPRNSDCATGFALCASCPGCGKSAR